MKDDGFLRFPELKEICGLSRSTVWRLEKEGSFPKSRKISLRATGWLKSEIEEWINEKIDK